MTADAIAPDSLIADTGSNVVAAPDRGDDMVLLLMACRKTEKYLPAILQTLDQLWPAHPEVVVATDGSYAGDAVFQMADVSFTELFRGAVDHVRETKPDAKYIFLLLEDLCPLNDVDQVQLDKLLDLVRRESLKYVVIPWHGNFKRDVWQKFGWTLDGTIEDDAIELMPIQKGWEAETSLVAAVWDVDHLSWVIDQKLGAGIHDPWRFEHAVPNNPETHYMFQGKWPTVMDGFLARGKLNPRAVSRKEHPVSPIVSQLREEYCGSETYFRARLKYNLTTRPKVFRRMKMRLDRLAPSVQAASLTGDASK